MPDLYQWRVRCTTDSVYRFVWTEDDTTVPACPDNGAHGVDSTLSAVVDFQEDNEVAIKEESVHTGGNLGIDSKIINAAASVITDYTTSWPHPISVLSVDFTVLAEHVGDHVDVIIGKDTIIGAIGANVAPASAWSAQNYTAGQTVTWTHPTFGSRVYTCILDTVSNEVPSNKTYWQHGLEMTVSNDVITYTQVGYHLTLDDGSNTDDMGRVLKVDKDNSKIYVETNPANSYSAVTPTYVKQSVYMVEAMELAAASNHKLGTTKIGGSYVPADTIVTVRYHNMTASPKVFTSWVEFLY